MQSLLSGPFAYRLTRVFFGRVHHNTGAVRFGSERGADTDTRPYLFTPRDSLPCNRGAGVRVKWRAAGEEWKWASRVTRTGKIRPS